MEICYAKSISTYNGLRFSSLHEHPHRIRSRFRSPRFQHFTCNSHIQKDKERTDSTNRLFMLGFGYVAQFLAEDLKKHHNWKISGTCTSTIKKRRLEDMGYEIELFNGDDEMLRSLNSLVDATHLLVSIPAVVGLGDPVLYQHWDLLRSQLCSGNLQWLCYLSSTSVYGDCSGSWVDEDYPTTPTTDSAKARLAAENSWLSLGYDLGVPVQVLRLAGIYGPGRSALNTIIKQGSLTDSQRMREARRFTSRVHVADIFQALKASIATPSSGRIYNVADDDPASREEVFAFAQTLVDRKWPGMIKATQFFNTSEPTSGKKVVKGEKRVLNSRLKNELGVRLLHPTYRSGLESIIESMENPFH